jgi:hypothetical protein
MQCLEQPTATPKDSEFHKTSNARATLRADRATAMRIFYFRAMKCYFNAFKLMQMRAFG